MIVMYKKDVPSVIKVSDVPMTVTPITLLSSLTRYVIGNVQLI